MKKICAIIAALTSLSAVSYCLEQPTQKVEMMNVPVRMDVSGSTVNVVGITIAPSTAPTVVTGTVSVTGITVSASTQPVEISNFPAQISTVSVVNFPPPVSTVTVVNMPAAVSLTTVTFNGVAQPVSGNVGINGSVSVANFPAQTSTVTVVNFPAQVSTVSVTNFPQQISTTTVVNLPAVTTVTYNGAAQPVTASQAGTWNINNTSVNVATVTVSGTPSVSITGTPTVNNNSINVATVSVSGTVPVNGTFWQATQPISGTVGLSTNTMSVSGSTVGVNGSVSISNAVTVNPHGVSGTVTVTPGTGTVNVALPASNLLVTGTAATGTGVTVTLPAVASQFHYISLIEIVKYFTAANAASATPLLVTSTNLPGSWATSFGQPLGTIGTTDIRVYAPASPLKSSVVGTATTIVCPATTGIIWRVNVFYYTGT